MNKAVILKKVVCKRVLSAVLAMVMAFSMLPMNVFADIGSAPTNFNEELVQEMAALCGDREQAEQILKTLYGDGLVDATGSPTFGDTFNVNGKKVTLEEFEKLIEQNDSDAEVTVDGIKTTWEKMKKMLEIKRFLASAKEFLDTGVEMDEEHQKTFNSLVEQMGDTGVSFEVAGDAIVPVGASGIDASNFVTLSVSKTSIAVPDSGTSNFNVIATSAAKKTYPITLKYAVDIPGFTISTSNATGTITIPANSTTASVSISFTRASTEKWKGTRKAFIQAYDITNSLFVNSKDTTKGYRTALLTIDLTRDDAFIKLPVYRCPYNVYGIAKDPATTTIPPSSYNYGVSDLYFGNFRPSRNSEYFRSQYPVYRGINYTTGLYRINSSEMDREQQDSKHAPMACVLPNSIPNGTFAVGSTIEFMPQYSSTLSQNQATTLKKFGLETYMSKTNQTDVNYMENIDTECISIDDYTESSGGVINAVRRTSDLDFSVGTSISDMFPWTASTSTTAKGTDLAAKSFPKFANAIYLSTTPGRSYTAADLKGKLFTYDLYLYGNEGTAPVNNANYLQYILLPELNCLNATVDLYSFDPYSTATGSMPSRNFRPGMVVPITITFNKELNISTGMELTVSGNKLTPVNAGAKDKTALFLYTVKEIDSGTPKITNFTFKDISAADGGTQQLTTSSSTLCNQMSNDNCKLETPDKEDSFTSVSVTADKITKEVKIKMDTNAQFEIQEIVENGKTIQKKVYPFRTWMAQNAEFEASTGKYYLKSIYASEDNGKTRTKLYVSEDDDLATVTAQYISTAVVTTGKVDRVVEFFMDPDIGSTINYITDTSKSAPLVLAYSKGYSLEPIVYIKLDPKESPDYFNPYAKQDLQITYNDQILYELSDPANPFYNYLGVPIPVDTEERIQLGYRFKPDLKATYMAPEDFLWVSGDESVMLLDSDGNIIPTGKTSSTKVIATLYALNGDSPDDVKAGKITNAVFYNAGAGKNMTTGLWGQGFTFAAGSSFLKVPKTSKQLKTVEGEDLSVLFSSDLTEKNATAMGNSFKTTITATLYNTDKTGTKTGASIGTFTVDSTMADWKSSIKIPASYLTNTCKKTEFNYAVDISAKEESTSKTFTDTALVTVKARPLKLSLSAPNGYFVMDNEVVPVEYNATDLKVINGVTDYPEVNMMIVRNSDGKTVAEENFKGGDVLANYKTNFNAAKVANGVLKDIYTVIVTGRNNDEDDWSTDSYILNVYNSSALDIIVRNSSSVAKKVGTSDTYVMDNTNYINGLNSSPISGTDAKTLVLGNSGITMEQLRDDANLSTMISINYGSYAWGLLSDQIAWSSSNSKQASVNYYQGGYYSNIEAYNYVSYIPTTDFLLMGRDDTKGSNVKITATHARIANGKMKKEIELEVKTLKDKLYLFQMLPKQKTTLKYENGKNKTVEIETDSNGQLALYEPDGIASDVRLVAESNEGTYMGTIDVTKLETSEQDITSLQVYPLNTYKLTNATSAVLYFKEPNGQPYKTKNLTLRGGVFRNGAYCPDATLSYNGKNEIDGREDLAVKTDEYGRVTIKFDSTQFWATQADRDLVGNAIISPDIPIQYMFELRNFDGGMRPKFVKVNPTLGYGMGTVKPKAETVKLVSANGKKSETYTDIRTMDSKGSTFTKDFDIYDFTQNVGPSDGFYETTIKDTVLFWGMPVGPKDAKGYTTFASKTYTTELVDESGVLVAGQTNTPTVYPFSTMPVSEIEYVMNDANLKGWLGTKERKRLITNFKEIETQTKDQDRFMGKEAFPFMVANMIGAEEPLAKGGTLETSALDFKDAMEEQAGVGSMLSMLNVNSAISTGLNMLVGAAGGDATPISIIVAPTKDIFTYNVIASVGRMADNDGKQDGFSLDYGDDDDDDDDDDEDDDDDDDDDEDDDEDEDDGDEEEEDEDDDSGVDVKFQMGGMVKARATFDFINNNWSFVIVSGDVNALLTVSKDWKKNFLVGSVPVTVSLELGAKIRGDMGFRTVKVDDKLSADYLVQIGARIYAEAFGGVGYDFGVMTLKFGMFGELGINAKAQFLKSNALGWKNGQLVGIDGEIGLKFVAKILVLKFQVSYTLGAFEFNYKWNSWDQITSYWEGLTKEGDSFSAMKLASGEVLYTINSQTVESRDYLSRYKRVWIEDGKGETTLLDNVKFSLASAGIGSSALITEDSKADTVQTNAYPFADPVISEDGEVLVYISDAGSNDPEKAVASFAVKNSKGGYTNMGDIFPIQKGESGDSSLTVSGYGGKYYATWIRQTEAIRKAANQPVTNEELSMILNSAEVYVAVYNPSTKAWTSEKLTNNLNPDIAPSISSSNGKAAVVWRSVVSSGTDKPLDFNVDDIVMYADYVGGKWNEASVLYNGSNGSVHSVDTAMLSTGEVLAAFTVKTGDDESNTNDTEAFYSLVDKNGDVKTIRITNDQECDENAQVVAIKEGSKEEFVMAWYTQVLDADTNESVGDVRLAGIDSKGLLDVYFAENIDKPAGVNANFRLAAAPNAGVAGVTVAWVQKTDDTGEPDYIEHDQIKAVKLYKNVVTEASVSGEEVIDEIAYISATGILTVSEMENGVKVDHMNLYCPDVKSVNSVLLVTDYSAGQSEYTGTIKDGENDVKVYTPTGESKMAKTETTFEDKFNIKKPVYPKSALVPGLSLPITFTVRNKGITPMKEVAVTVDKVKKTFTGLNILPGTSSVFTVNYEIPEKNIKDIDYIVESGTLDSKSGKITIYLPDVAIREMSVVREEDGERDIEMLLINNSDMLLEGSDKTVVVGLYADGDYSKLLAKHVVPTKDLLLIDNGAYQCTETVKLSDLISAQSSDGGQEVPNVGLNVYAKAWIENSDSSIVSETNSMNNTNAVHFNGLAQTRGEDITIFDEYSETENAVLVSAVVQNNLMTEAVCENIKAELYDENGSVVGYAQTGTGLEKDNIVLGAEEKTEVNFTILKENLKGDVYSAKVMLAGNTVNVALKYGAGSEKEDETIEVSINKTLETTFEEMDLKIIETVKGYADYEFEGWFKDENFTEEFDLKTEVKEDLVLYAKWKKLPQVISIDKIDFADEAVYGDGTIAPSGTAQIKILPENIDISTTATALVVCTYEGTGETVYNSTIPPKDVGTYSVTATVPNFRGQLEDSFSITPRELTISGLQAVSRDFNAKKEITLTGGKLENVVSGDDVAIEAKDAVALLQDENAGDDKAVDVSGFALKGEKASNYSLTQPSALTVTINKATLTTEILPTPTASPYGTMVKDMIIAGGKVMMGSEEITGAWFFDETATQIPEVGDETKYTAVFNPNMGTSNFNTLTCLVSPVAEKSSYDGAQVSSDVKVLINRAMTGLKVGIQDFDIPSSFKNASIKSVVCQSDTEGIVTNIAVDENGDIIYDVGSVEAIGVSAVYDVTISNKNYNDYTASLNFTTINKDVVDITGVSVKSKVYDGNEAQITGSPIAEIQGTSDNVTQDCGSLNYQYTSTDEKGYSSSTPPSEVGDYKLVISVDSDNEKYMGKSSNISFSISQKEVSIANALATNRVYDGTTSVSVAASQIDGLVQKDSAGISLTPESVLGQIESKDVGSAKRVELLANFSLTGEKASNYKLVQPENITVDISQAELTVNADVSVILTKVYDGTTAAGTLSGKLTVIGKVNSDDVDVTAQPDEYADADAGINKTANLLLTLAGTDKNNYKLANNTYSFDRAEIEKSIYAESINKNVNVTVNEAVSGSFFSLIPAEIFKDAVIKSITVTSDEHNMVAVNGENYTISNNSEIGATALCELVVESKNYKEYTIPVSFTVEAKVEPPTEPITEITTESTTETATETTTKETTTKETTTKETTTKEQPTVTTTTSPSGSGSSGGSGSSSTNGSVNSGGGGGGGTKASPASTTKTDNQKPNVPVEAKDTGLSVKDIDQKSEKHSDFIVNSNEISYIIPENAIDTNEIMKALGENDKSKAKISIAVDKNVNQDSLKTVVEAMDGTLITSGIKTVISAKSDNGAVYEFNKFESYIHQVIEISKEEAEKVTTAVAVYDDGTYHYVPTQVYEENGKWYASINVIVNNDATYALINCDKNFTDTAGKWFENVVHEMASRTIIKGIGDGTFEGERSISRAEFATIIITALGLPVNKDADVFEDVSDSDWYYGTVNTAYQYGLISGRGNGTFAPNDKIKRQEAMVIIRNAAKLARMDTNTDNIDSDILQNFHDVENMSDWATDSVKFNVASGMIVGSDGKLRLQDEISRAETAALAYQFLQKAGLINSSK